MIEIKDETGSLVRLTDIDDARDACLIALTQGLTALMAVPALAVNLPNILRCLNELRAIRHHLETQGQPK